MKNALYILFFFVFSTVSSASETVKGRVVRVIPQGEETVIVISKGSKAGVAIGDRGVFMPNASPSFKIIEVTGFQSRGLVKKKASDVSRLRSVVIRISKK